MNAKTVYVVIRWDIFGERIEIIDNIYENEEDAQKRVNELSGDWDYLKKHCFDNFKK